MFRKSNLRKLTDSISKENFETFKHAVTKKTVESDFVKKLYEKFMGKPIPEDRVVVIKICGDVPTYFTDKPYYTVKITEVLNDADAPYLRVDTELHIDVNDRDIMEASHHFGKYIRYRKFVSLDAVVNEYIECKALQYDVELDNETYYKLRNLVESL